MEYEVTRSNGLIYKLEKYQCGDIITDNNSSAFIQRQIALGFLRPAKLVKQDKQVKGTQAKGIK